MRFRPFSADLQAFLYLRRQAQGLQWLRGHMLEGLGNDAGLYRHGF
jgi:hypothetical protein